MLNTINISNKKVAYAGAKIAVAGVFGYSLLVMLYAIIRSSFIIYSIMRIGERSNILLLNGFSFAYSISIFSLLMALLSSIAGAVAGVMLKIALQYFNTNFRNRKAIVISFFIAFATLLFMYILLFAILKNWMTFYYIETFSFWFLLPAVIYVGACIIGGSRLNTILGRGITSNY